MLPIDLTGVLLLWIAGVATWDTGMVTASAVSRSAQATGPAAGGRSGGKVALAVSGIVVFAGPLLWARGQSCQCLRT